MKQPMMSVNTSIQVFSTNSPELVAFVSLPPENRGELTTPSSPEDNVKKNVNPTETETTERRLRAP